MKRIILISIALLSSPSFSSVRCDIQESHGQGSNGVSYLYPLSATCTITNENSTTKNYTITQTASIYDNYPDWHLLNSKCSTRNIDVAPHQSITQTFQTNVAISYPHIGYFYPVNQMTVSGAESYDKSIRGIISVPH